MSVETSREAFLQALERLLSQPDPGLLGVNTVAREAGLNKVLLYRYFGSWEGLLEAFAPRVNLWRELRHETAIGLDAGRWSNLADLLTWLFTAYLDRLLASPLQQNLLRRSLATRDALQVALERDREDAALGLMALVGSRYDLRPGVDYPSLTALLMGGLTWLALAGTRAGVFNGLTFEGATPNGPERLRQAIASWVALTVPDREITL